MKDSRGKWLYKICSAELFSFPVFKPSAKSTESQVVASWFQSVLSHSYLTNSSNAHPPLGTRDYTTAQAESLKHKTSLPRRGKGSKKNQCWGWGALVERMRYPVYPPPWLCPGFDVRAPWTPSVLNAHARIFIRLVERESMALRRRSGPLRELGPAVAAQLCAMR